MLGLSEMNRPELKRPEFTIKAAAREEKEKKAGSFSLESGA